eukprot:12657086-Ditylum_brightwellii.AAC.1
MLDVLEEQNGTTANRSSDKQCLVPYNDGQSGSAYYDDDYISKNEKKPLFDDDEEADADADADADDFLLPVTISNNI